jgi:hypothetical protein
MLIHCCILLDFLYELYYDAQINEHQMELWCKPLVKGFLFCTPHSNRFCRGSTDGGRDERGMWHG